MSYLSENIEQLDNFRDIQSKLSNSVELLLEFKRIFSEIWVKNSNLTMEQIMDNTENMEFVTKINELQQQISSLEKRVIGNREHLMSSINVLAEHLSCLEKKNMGLVDKMKFWNKPKSVVEEISNINQKNQPTLFNFNEE